ncbi:hypothetical protein WJX74_010740 [Apatococcus lobatus]|uniref:Uncharacterized protein n=1 Tax=Apatococcus lobatus TaxID=904363 RepID=A0AAW1R0C8_9CHLO
MAAVASVSYCTRNPDTDVCKQACTASTGTDPTTPGFTKDFCNNLYANYCADQANQSRSICACHLPWSSYPGSDLVSQSFPNFQEPLCWFNNCKSTGYYKGLPSNLCPKCLQNLTINIGANSKADIENISQSCNSSPSPTTTPLPAAASTPVAASPQPSPTASALAWMQANAKVAGIILAVVVVLVLVMAMAS